MTTRSALLIVDMQEQFRSEFSGDARLGDVLEHIGYVAQIFRGAGAPVVWVLDCEDVSRDDPVAAPIPELQRLPTDLTSWKRDSNAFWDTDLAERLRELQVGFVVVAGFAAEHCVVFTYHGARERGLTAALLQNGVLSSDAGAVAAVMRHHHVVSYPVLELLLRG